MSDETSRLRFLRVWCLLFGHRIVFPEDVWADLTCARCDWAGPKMPEPLPW